MKYTVIGLYQDTSEVLCDHVEASDPHAAMAQVAAAAHNSELEILGAIVVAYIAFVFVKRELKYAELSRDSMGIAQPKENK